MWDLLRRAETGAIIKQRDFDMKRYWPRLKELVKEYDIKYDPEHLVPIDDSVLDDVYEAGMRLLLDVGFLCIDSSRLMTFEESEVKAALRNLPGKGTLGEGKDAVTFEHHDLEDKRTPTVLSGPTGTPLSEQYALKIYESYAKEPFVGVIYMGAPQTIEGLTVKVGSPLELQAEVTNVAWARSATRKAGRPGLALYGVCFPSLSVDMASSSPEYGYRKEDLRCLWPLPQMKVDYATLTRALHFAHYGIKSNTAGVGYIGGMAGGPEGAAITTIAECLGITLLFRPFLIQSIPLNNMYSPWVGESDSMSLWANSVCNAAMNKHTKMILMFGCYTYAGPCTEMCLWEEAAESIAGDAVGAHPYGPGPNSGLVLDHCTGMEARLRGEVACAAAGIKREDANEIVKKLVSKYQKVVESKKPPRGKSFAECYDTETVTPSKEYSAVYAKVQAELEDLGLKLVR